MADATDLGVSSTDNITSDTTPTFTGTAEAGTTVTILVDGVARGTATATGGTYSITTTALTAGTHLVTATATDAAGNLSVASAALSVTVDNVRPTVTVNQAAGQADPTNTAVHFTVTFSEAVSGFTASDVTLGGTATGRSVLSVTDSGDQMTYDVAVTATGSGTITASVAASLAQRMPPGNVNTASTSTDNTVTYEITAPDDGVGDNAG